MNNERFEKLFGTISNNLTLDLLGQKKEHSGTSIKKFSSDLIWDSIGLIKNCDYIGLEDGRIIPCRRFFKRPIRILFFILLSEFENRSFRIHERKGRLIAELNEKNLNDFIKELVGGDLINLQSEYESRARFKKDLKAVSSFRNVIMHVNKKLEKEIEADVLIERKRQILKLLSALQQISDRMNCADCESLRNKN